MSDKTSRRGGRPKDLEDQSDNDEYENSQLQSTDVSLLVATSPCKNGEKAPVRDLYNQLFTEIINENEAEAARKLEDSKMALSRGPRAENWHNIIFVYQYQFHGTGKGLPRRPMDPNAQINLPIVQEGSPDKYGQRRLCFYASMGYHIKSSLLWYEIPPDCNSEMTQTIHESAIIQPYIEKWIKKGYSLALEVDGHGSHGPATDGLACVVKERHGAKHFVSYPPISDLSPIETFLIVPNQYLQECPNYDTDILKDLIDEGWRHLSQETIDGWVEAIPQQLHHTIAMGGK